MELGFNTGPASAKIGRFSRILVTGGAGFIGSHVVDRLLAEGLEVGVLDNFTTRSRANLPSHASLRIHNCDVSDSKGVGKISGDYDAILHQAALVGNTVESEDPILLHRTNVVGTLNLLEASANSNIERLVFASSAAVYGQGDCLPVSEDAVPNPLSPYGFSKLEGEKYCQFFARAYGLRTVCLRYFNVYGPGQRPGPYTGVISKFIENIARGEPPVIFGDGKQTRDFVHAHDVAEANLLALSRNPAPGDVFNIATGTATEINQLALMLSETMGRPHLKPVHAPERPSDVRYSCGDFTKAKEILDFDPRVQLEEGLRSFTHITKRGWKLSHSMVHKA